MKEILETLVIAIVLVIFVVYLFLQDWRATLIPMLVVPVSLMGTFVIFPLVGFSINTLTMFGLVLAIGQQTGKMRSSPINKLFTLEQISNALIASQKDREFREQQELLTGAGATDRPTI